MVPLKQFQSTASLSVPSKNYSAASYIGHIVPLRALVFFLEEHMHIPV
ncbi:MAG: hypothetical protein K0S28_2200 [Paucimonas sp.]|nr:hypothetical protein [Paucimonas sp.]